MNNLKQLAVGSVLFGLSAGVATAQELDFGGETKLDIALEGSDIVKSRLEINPAIEYASSGGSMFVGSLRLRTDMLDELTPGSPAYHTYAGATTPLTLGDHVTAELRDFYVDMELGGIAWRVGKQQIVWGQLDGFKLLDQVNPQSFQEFILEDFDQSRIGLWSISAEFQVGGADLQLVYSPDTTVGDTPERDALFAFQASRFRFGTFGETGGGSTAIRFDKPDDPIGDGVYAARLSGYVGGWDLALVGLTGLDHTPVAALEVRDGKATLSRMYRHRTVVGASASTSFGAFVFRGETGFYPSRSFNEGIGLPNSIVERDQLTVAAALDYDGPSGLFLSAQLIYDTVFDAPEYLVRPDSEVILSLYARKYFRNETFMAEARFYSAAGASNAALFAVPGQVTNGLFGDSLFRGKLTYILDDQMELAAGFDVFFGKPMDVYGQFDARDRLTFQIKRYF